MKCQSTILVRKALGVGRREGSWAAKAASDLIIHYLGYHIFFLCLEKCLLSHSTGAKRIKRHTLSVWTPLDSLEGGT